MLPLLNFFDPTTKGLKNKPTPNGTPAYEVLRDTIDDD